MPNLAEDIWPLACAYWSVPDTLDTRMAFVAGQNELINRLQVLIAGGADVSLLRQSLHDRNNELQVFAGHVDLQRAKALRAAEPRWRRLDLTVIPSLKRSDYADMRVIERKDGAFIEVVDRENT